MAAVDESGKLIPEADHQTNINRQKYFEIATVIIMIIVGFGYFAISSGRAGIEVTGSTSATDLGAILRSENFEQLESETILGQTFDRYRVQNGLLRTVVDVVSTDGDEQTNAIIFSAGLPGDTPFPSDDIAEKAIQDSFDEIARLGELLVPSSIEGLSKAVNTTVPVSNSITEFRKGVAQTNSGWKITYIAYRAYEEDGSDIPLLLFVYQRLDAASDPAQESFNKTLFTAANEGENIIEAMRTKAGDSSNGH